jgi:uncharacterized DUF497 family protein
MKFTWDNTKRTENLRKHGIDFADARKVFEGWTFTFPDNRFAYNERRFITLGFLAGITVSIAHTETDHEIRIISFRKASKQETKILFSNL